MKKMMKGFKDEVLKKGVVLMLAGALLCSQSLTAAAASVEHATTKLVHTCAYSIVDQRLVEYHSAQKHTYYDGSFQTNPDGSISPVVQSCLELRIEYKGTKKCACGNSLGECYWIETTHSRCGKIVPIEWL